MITKDAVFQSDVGQYTSDIFVSKERGIEEKGMASRGGNRRLEINLLSTTHLLNISALWAHMNTCFVGRDVFENRTSATVLVMHIRKRVNPICLSLTGTDLKVESWPFPFPSPSRTPLCTRPSSG